MLLTTSSPPDTQSTRSFLVPGMSAVLVQVLRTCTSAVGFGDLAQSQMCFGDLAGTTS